MTPSEHEAERLHEAVEASVRGGAGDPSDLPADLTRLVGAAGMLAAHGRASAGEPRPSFVLALEEQLRCDLRLDLAGRPPPSRAPVSVPMRVAVLTVSLGLLVGLIALGLAIDRAAPGHALRRWQPALHSLQVALVPSPSRKATMLLAQGWRHVSTLRRLASAGQLSPSEVARLLADMGAAYDGALRYAAESGDERVLRQVLRESEDALAILDELAQEAGPETNPLLEAAREALQVRILRFVPGVAGGLPGPTPTPLLPPVATEPSHTPWPTGAVPVLVTATALPTQTQVPPPTVDPLPATPTPPLPTALVPAQPTVTNTPTPRPPAPPVRERTPTPVPPTAIPTLPSVGPVPRHAHPGCVAHQDGRSRADNGADRGARPRARVANARRAVISRRQAAWLLAAGVLALVVALAVGVPGALARPPAGPRQADEWPCDLVSRRVARPADGVPLEAEITVTMSLLAACAPVTRPLHVVLVVDASSDMRSQLSALQDALVDAVVDLRLAERPWLSMGVVSFAEQAEVKRALSNGQEQVIAGVRDIAAAGAPATAAGLNDAVREALRMLPAARPGRSEADVRSGPREVIVVLSAGVESGACDRVRDQAADARASGVLVMTACVGANCDRTCLAEVPSSVSGRRFAFRSWSSWSFLSELLLDLAAASGPFFSPIDRVSVMDVLHENLMYQGGGDPTTGDGRRLSWSFAPWSADAVTRSFQVQAVGIGRFLVSRSVSATVFYNGTFWPGPSRTMALMNPVLEVFDPRQQTPTATPTVPPTPTATPTRLGTATPGPTVTGAPTRRPERLWLPYLSRLSCPLARPATDLVLLLDVSGSMQGPASGYPGDRRAAAQAVAGFLLDGLGAQDQVAVLQYGARFDVLAPLAPCCGPARAGLAGLGYLDGTRLELALAEAARQLTGPAGRATARRALVLFTDGDLNQTDESALAVALATLRDLGVMRYAVGVSDEADVPLLVRLAGHQARVFLTGRDGPTPALWPAGPPPRCW